MKKTKLMRAATILLVLTLVTSCFVGGTFAKYITTNNGTDNARVAHWGFNTSGSNTGISTLFDKSNDTGVLNTVTDSDSVERGLLAPGTTGKATFTFVNADNETNPEVAYRVTVDTNGSTAKLSDELEAAVTFYVDDPTKATALTWEQVIAKIKGFSGEEDGSKDYAPGDDIPEAIRNNVSHTVEWVWAFDRSADADDTELGNKAIAALEKLTLAINVTVEQLDTYTVSP